MLRKSQLNNNKNDSPDQENTKKRLVAKVHPHERVAAEVGGGTGKSVLFSYLGLELGLVVLDDTVRVHLA